MGRKHWWKVLLLILAVSAAGVTFIGIKTYQDAPPIPDFVDDAGKVVVSAESVLRGQVLFQKYALMEYGSMFGDGAGRGPDYTADALHQLALEMVNSETAGVPDGAAADTRAAAGERIRRELKANRYQAENNSVALSTSQAYAFARLVDHYNALFTGTGKEALRPTRYISDQGEIRDLTAFFFWGAWVCAVERPGYAYSYTNNWPYDELAGNRPTTPILLWSILGGMGLIVALGLVLYAYGRLGASSPDGKDAPALATRQRLAGFAPTATQRASYKFFWVSGVLFLVQVLAGVLTVHDFVGFTTFFGVDISKWLPITVVRSWHLQLSLLWISTCWIGATIFLLPMISRPEPAGQLRWVNRLFWLLVILVAGTVVGIFLGPMGWLGQWWRSFGHQGWEFVEIGKAWQWMLYGALIVWGIIVYRGVRPALRAVDPWAMPNWLLYTIVSIILLLASGFAAGARTNFVIADFWRWCVIHMWVEAFFEVFTTILVGYFLYVMGLVSARAAVRVVYFASILFLGSGLLGISHNFYWNAKSVETVALGSVFSTLQVVPLILLTLEAWRFRRMPSEALRALPSVQGQRPGFGLAEPFLFMLAVNFWNFLGAGVFGFIINLPIVNYYEHGTYLTVNHGHAALIGVYGNLAIAAILFCGRHLIKENRWSPNLLRCSFWSLNIGLMLMVVLDLFPAGIAQLLAVMDHGLWYARSQQFVLGNGFQTMTWLRIIGGALFVVGGVAPLAWFLVSRSRSLRDAQPGGHLAPLVVGSDMLAAIDDEDAAEEFNGNGRRELDVPSRA